MNEELALNNIKAAFTLFYYNRVFFCSIKLIFYAFLSCKTLNFWIEKLSKIAIFCHYKGDWEKTIQDRALIFCVWSYIITPFSMNLQKHYIFDTFFFRRKKTWKKSLQILTFLKKKFKNEKIILETFLRFML